MSKKKVEPLAPHEENILRATIDEAEASLVDTPVKTTRRLLATIDELRKQNIKLQSIESATDRINKFVAGELRSEGPSDRCPNAKCNASAAPDIEHGAFGRSSNRHCCNCGWEWLHLPSLVEAFDAAVASPPFKLATPFEPLLAIEKFDGPLPTIPASDFETIRNAVDRIKIVHPDVDAWLHELAERATGVDMVERELLATLVRALHYAIENGIYPIDHVTSVAFVQNPLDRNTFFLRMTTNGEKSERILTRSECVVYCREMMATRAFDLAGRTLYGAELADLIERGDLP